ncbi:MAG: hypothetical protein B0W54_18995 [Cellvibrio sp. 79]|nr:MAG: hypothetical protein B0W54_18995 [Cellvibrio sp. 79]
MNNFVKKAGWNVLAIATLISFTSFSAIADDLGVIEIIGTPYDTGDDPGFSTVFSGFIPPTPGGIRIHDLHNVQQALAAKRACKNKATEYLRGCNTGRNLLHKASSAYCSTAFWIGGALGLAGGWAALEGEGGAFLLLGGSSYITLQWGADCQTDMDRAYTAGLAQCTVEYEQFNNACDEM